MTMTISTLRPGLLVSLKTSTRGNVSYDKQDLEHKRNAKTDFTKWQTGRTIADVKEFERAKKTMSAATLPIRQICVWSAHGWLCPEADRDDLDAAVRECRRIISEFNETAKITRLDVYVMVGRVAADDVEAVRSINKEVRDLMESMESGLKNLDVKTVRDAANKAKQLGQMLSPDAQGRVATAIGLARTAARKIVKAGDEAAMEIDRRAIRKITEQRTTFLDMDDEPVTVEKTKARVRAVDLNVD